MTTTMTRLLATATLACACAAVLLAQTGTPSRIATTQAPAASKPAANSAAPVPAGDAKTHRAFLTQYCIGCHSSRSPQPASDPVNLEKASLDEVIADAATWERVLRKLRVRAMPPTGSTRPQEAEYAAFTTWLADSLDRAWASRGTTPERFAVHRLNR